MLPAVNAIAAYTPPPTIVATGIPGNNTLHVPADNVPPTVSNVQIDNNARGNGTALAAPAPTSQQAPQAPVAFSSFIANFDGTPTTLSLNSQTTFMAQLMSQDVSTQARGVLSEYEKLITIAQVKYKPSNATLPLPEPASIFGKILQQEQQTRVTQKFVTEQAATTSVAAQTVASNAAPAPKAATQQTRTNDTENSESEAPEATPIDNTPVAQPRAISAYLATVSRNESGNKKPVDLV